MLTPATTKAINMDDQLARDRTAHIIAQLQTQGRSDEAWHLHRALGEKTRDALLFTLREACETVLTAVEAIDPATETLLEALRADIDLWFSPGHPPVSPG